MLFLDWKCKLNAAGMVNTPNYAVVWQVLDINNRYVFHSSSPYMDGCEWRQTSSVHGSKCKESGCGWSNIGYPNWRASKYVWAHFNSPTSKRPYMATTTPVATGKHNPLQIMERQSTWVTSLVPGFGCHLALSHRGKSSVTFSIPRLSLIKLSAGTSVLPSYLVAFFLRGGEPRNVSVTLRGWSHLLPLRFEPPNVTIPPACIRRNEPGDEAKPDKAIRWNVRPT